MGAEKKKSHFLQCTCEFHYMWKAVFSCRSQYCLEEVEWRGSWRWKASLYFLWPVKLKHTHVMWATHNRVNLKRWEILLVSGKSLGELAENVCNKLPKSFAFSFFLVVLQSVSRVPYTAHLYFPVSFPENENWEGWEGREKKVGGTVVSFKSRKVYLDTKKKKKERRKLSKTENMWMMIQNWGGKKK